MDWKDVKVQLDELATKARDGGDVSPIVSDAIAAITEQMGQLHQSVSHIAERLDAVTNQLATLETRVHENVE